LNPQHLDSLQKERDALFIENTYLKSLLLSIRRIIATNSIDYSPNIYDVLNNLEVNDKAKFAYDKEWQYYNSYILNYNLDLYNKSDANSYITYIENKYKRSTCIKKRSKVQHILRKVLRDDNFKLRRIRKINYRKQKYAMSSNEISDYLQEQKNINYEEYLIQKFIIYTGCRINAACNLKIEHLECLWKLDKTSYEIVIPDTKTGKYEAIVPKELCCEIIEFIGIKNENEYVFFKDIKSEKRTKIINRTINKVIRNSEVLPKSRHYAMCVHMFRATKAQKVYEKMMKKAENKAGLAIGNAEKSRATKYYIKKQERKRLVLKYDR
jgi:integrase